MVGYYSEMKNCKFTKISTPPQVLSRKLSKIFRTSVLYNTSEWLLLYCVNYLKTTWHLMIFSLAEEVKVFSWQVILVFLFIQFCIFCICCRGFSNKYYFANRYIRQLSSSNCSHVRKWKIHADFADFLEIEMLITLLLFKQLGSGPSPQSLLTFL